MQLANATKLPACSTCHIAKVNVICEKTRDVIACRAKVAVIAQCLYSGQMEMHSALGGTRQQHQLSDGNEKVHVQMVHVRHCLWRFVKLHSLDDTEEDNTSTGLISFGFDCFIERFKSKATVAIVTIE